MSKSSRLINRCVSGTVLGWSTESHVSYDKCFRAPCRNCCTPGRQSKRNEQHTHEKRGRARRNGKMEGHGGDVADDNEKKEEDHKQGKNKEKRGVRKGRGGWGDAAHVIPHTHKHGKQHLGQSCDSCHNGPVGYKR